MDPAIQSTVEDHERRLSRLENAFVSVSQDIRQNNESTQQTYNEITRRIDRLYYAIFGVGAGIIAALIGVLFSLAQKG